MTHTAIILHAYSTRNSGDGLLVDLTIELVKEALGPATKINVLALDAQSFPQHIDTVQYPLTQGGVFKRIQHLIGLISVVVRARPGKVRPLVKGMSENPTILIAVGGGYLRADGFRYGISALLAHGIQAAWAQRTGLPTVYFPQSVGPFRTIPGLLLKRIVEGVRGLHVRDGRSMTFEKIEASRTPDLAVLHIANSERNPTRSGSSTPKIALVARELRRRPEVDASYRTRLVALKEKIEGLVPAVQSSGRGNDDPAFYQKMGWGDSFLSLRELLAAGKLSVVVSVRLHGALEALVNGVPAIHLSYERKGFGAYEDLGLSEFVHNANRFDVALVEKQARELAENPARYWDALSVAIPTIKIQREKLINDIQGAGRVD